METYRLKTRHAAFIASSLLVVGCSSRGDGTADGPTGAAGAAASGAAGVSSAGGGGAAVGGAGSAGSGAGASGAAGGSGAASGAAGGTLASWRTISSKGAPTPRLGPTFTWTSGRLFVWGGMAADYASAFGDGAMYEPKIDAWVDVPKPVSFAGRTGTNAVWTGSRVLIWGGGSSGKALCGTAQAPLQCFYNTGASFDPSTLTWKLLPTPTVVPAGATAGVTLSARDGHASAWLSDRLFVWGGFFPGATPVGAEYFPNASPSWKESPPSGALDWRGGAHFAAQGASIFVWGGTTGFGTPIVPGGGVYTVANGWKSLPAGGPSPRFDAEVIWAGDDVVVLGGVMNGVPAGDGWIYRPASDSWQQLPTHPVLARHGLVAVFTGKEVIVWGGCNGPSTDCPRDGARLDRATLTWAGAIPDAPVAGRVNPAAAWSGDELIFWGGCRFPEGAAVSCEGDGAAFRP